MKSYEVSYVVHFREPITHINYRSFNQFRKPYGEMEYYVTLPSSVRVIEDEAFAYTPLRGILIPK